MSDVMAALARIRVVLVEPAGARNVGSTARVMKNFGLSRLVLVNPQCEPMGEEARRMAVHGDDLLQQAVIVSSLPKALEGCQRAIATTGRPRAENISLELPEVALPWLLPPTDRPTTEWGQSALLFGPEERGLSNHELVYAHRCIQIPSNAAYPSLNLAQAVGVCGYVLYRAALASPNLDISAQGVDVCSKIANNNTDSLADLENIEQYFQHLESLLLKIGYLYPHTALSRLEKFRRLLHRAAPSEQELAMLRGILRQMDWALTTHPVSPPEPPEDSTHLP